MTDAQPVPAGASAAESVRGRGTLEGTLEPRRGLLVGIVLFVLGVAVVLPLLVHDVSYGEMAIPGSATVRLPAGPVDVTVSSEGLDDDTSVPPLSIRVLGADGTPPLEVTESRQAKCLSSDCDAQMRVWVVQVPREADYRVTVDGEAYGNHRPTLAFGRFVWNDVLLALLALGVVIRWAIVVTVAVVAGFGFLALLLDTRAAMTDTAASTNEARINSVDGERFRPVPANRVDDPQVKDLVLDYPEPSHRVAGRVGFGLSALLFVGVPMGAIYGWFHLPGGVPVCWLPVVILGLVIAGVSTIFVRIALRRALIRSRRANGDGWLRLSGTALEVHGRSDKPRRYELADIEEFMLVESRDDEGGVTVQVGFRFTPEHRLEPSNKRRLRRAAADPRDPARADVCIDGYWDGPLDDAVAMLNGWLSRYRVN